MGGFYRDEPRNLLASMSCKSIYTKGLCSLAGREFGERPTSSRDPGPSFDIPARQNQEVCFPVAIRRGADLSTKMLTPPFLDPNTRLWAFRRLESIC